MGIVTSLGVEGTGTFNNASISENNQSRLDPGIKVHRRCHQLYTNKKNNNVVVWKPQQRRHLTLEPNAFSAARICVGELKAY